MGNLLSNFEDRAEQIIDKHCAECTECTPCTPQTECPLLPADIHTEVPEDYVCLAGQTPGTKRCFKTDGGTTSKNTNEHPTDMFCIRPPEEDNMYLCASDIWSLHKELVANHYTFPGQENQVHLTDGGGHIKFSSLVGKDLKCMEENVGPNDLKVTSCVKDYAAYGDTEFFSPKDLNPNQYCLLEKMTETYVCTEDLSSLGDVRKVINHTAAAAQENQVFLCINNENIELSSLVDEDYVCKEEQAPDRATLTSCVKADSYAAMNATATDLFSPKQATNQNQICLVEPVHDVYYCAEDLSSLTAFSGALNNTADAMLMEASTRTP